MSTHIKVTATVEGRKTAHSKETGCAKAHKQSSAFVVEVKGDVPASEAVATLAMVFPKEDGYRLEIVQP